jgi:uncharacterized hydrophobic protein (TIGR00271 family)
MKSWLVIKRYLRNQLLIEQEEHFIDTKREIVSGANFSGFNFWILGFAMIIACIGLNTDSTSAVIGAMLISPLMGPIVGFAFGLSVGDVALKKKSLRNWLWMTIISLIASALFFWISPFDNNTTALASFTKATIFDILLAFFGGMAGFIGILKREGTKVIAGVAVATACMPPLCTAGFGIAHADYTYFLGGLYFYLINCLFIGLVTFLLSRFVGHRQRLQEAALNPGARWLWTIVIVIMLVPGGWIVWLKWKEQQKVEQGNTLTTEEQLRQLEKRVLELEQQIERQRPKP